MRNTLIASTAIIGLAVAPAFAQGAATTQVPPAPRASSQGMQPSNSLPDGAATGTRSRGGSGLETTDMGAAPSHVRDRAYRSRATRHGAYHDTGHSGAMNESAPATGEYRGGVNSPLSRNASNIVSSDTKSEIAPRLPSPDASGNSPQAFLVAAQKALDQGRTGAAQEALERAETRVLTRATDPSQANSPDDSAMVQHISDARRALGNRNMSGAKSAVSMALNAPATTRQGGPVGQPSFTPRQASPME